MKQLLGKSPSRLFATQTPTGHVIRGAVAFALLYLAMEQQHLHPAARCWRVCWRWWPCAAARFAARSGWQKPFDRDTG